MAIQYFCDNQFRAQRFRTDNSISINGIDYLEVLDSEAPVEALRQRTLLVRLFRPVPPTLTATNVVVRGGVRVTPVHVQWIGSADAAADLEAAGLIDAAERAYFETLPEPDHLLLVRTDSDGDYSIYTLQLITSPTDDQPPDGFDPILSAVDFSFKVECPTDFDCAVDENCPPTEYPRPAINYLAKDYNSFRQLILDRMAVTNPDWNETHLPDLNIALVELLAYAGDYLSYFQDSVGTEAYLDSARRRTSVRRHARLLNYAMHDGCNARTWVCFTAEAGVSGTVLAAATSLDEPQIRLLTHMPSEARKLDESDLDRIVGVHQPAIFELQQSVTLYEAHNQISFYTWGDEDCCLPEGATQATLRSSVEPSETLHLAPGDLLIFEEVINPTVGLAPELAHRQAVRLTSVMPAVDPLDDVAVVNIEWDATDALAFPLCLSARQDDTLIEEMAVARGNIGLADHGRTVGREPLPEQVGHRTYRPLLSETGVTVAATIEASLPAATILDQDPRHALPVVALAGDGESWSSQRDLLDSDRFAPHFVAEVENDGRAYLRFGDDLYGRRPSADAFSAADEGAVYRIGGGPEGNIGAETLFHMIGTDLSAVTAVRNPLPAIGGTEAERLEEVRRYAPQAFRRQERAVTIEDYAEVTMRHPAVQRAVASRRWTGSWYTIFVTIDRLGGLPVDAPFEDEIRLHLEKYRLTGHDVEVDGPRFVPLDIRMTVCVKPGYFRSDIKEALYDLFSCRRLADGRVGFFHPDRFTFGQPVYLSDVIATAMGVTGVQWVDILPSSTRDHRFHRWGQEPNREIEAGRIAMSRLEIAQLEQDPSQPENGRIEFYMEGGQ